MATLPSLPPAISADEWRRAIALMAAVDTHTEGTTLSPVTRERNVLLSARKFEAYLRDGQL
jgi:hypothetical protein